MIGWVSRCHLFEFGSKSMYNGLYELISSHLIVVLMVITNRNWKIEPFETGRADIPFLYEPFLIQRLSIESLAWVGYILGQFQTQTHSPNGLNITCIYIIWINRTRNRLDDVAISNQPSFVSGVLWLFLVPLLLCSVDPLESNYRENTFPLWSTTMFLLEFFIDTTHSFWHGRVDGVVPELGWCARDRRSFMIRSWSWSDHEWLFPNSMEK